MSKEERATIREALYRAPGLGVYHQDMTPPDSDSSSVDPYRNFRFIVRVNDKAVAGFSKLGGLSKTTEPRIPGQAEYGPIRLERGLTVDSVFEQWANKIWYYPNTGRLGQEMSLADFRQDLNIVLYNSAGQAVMSYSVFNCWPSEYHAMPELDASSNAVAIERLTLQNEGWTRDDSLEVPEPPAFSPPRE